MFLIFLMETITFQSLSSLIFMWDETYLNEIFDIKQSILFCVARSQLPRCYGNMLMLVIHIDGVKQMVS